MALAFINAGENSNYTGGTVLTLTNAGVHSLTAGNLVVVCVRGSNSSAVTDSLGNTYTLRASDPASILWIYSCANCLGGSAVITASFSAFTAYVSIVSQQFSGAATSGELYTGFTTAAVTSGATIDLTYDTGGFSDSLTVGFADVFNAGNYSFTATTTVASSVVYTEPVTDHTSAGFFYRILTVSSASEIVRATCSISGFQKNFLVAVFKSATSVVLASNERTQLSVALG